MKRLLLALLLLATPASAVQETFTLGGETNVVVRYLPRVTPIAEKGPQMIGVMTWRVFSPECKGAGQRDLAIRGKEVAGCKMLVMGEAHNFIPDAGLNFLRDAFAGTTSLSSYRYHCMGSSSQAVAASDTGCVSQSFRTLATINAAAGAGVFRTVASTTVGSNMTLNEWALMSASSGGTVWSRIVLSAPVAVTTGQVVTTDYQLTLARP